MSRLRQLARCPWRRHSGKTLCARGACERDADAALRGLRTGLESEGAFECERAMRDNPITPCGHCFGNRFIRENGHDRWPCPGCNPYSPDYEPPKRAKMPNTKDRLTAIEQTQSKILARLTRLERTFLAHSDLHHDNSDGPSPASPLREWHQTLEDGIEAMRQDLREARR